MPSSIPGQSESAFIGYAIVTALLDRLVQKKIVDEADINAVLSSAHEELRHSDAMLQQRSADLIAGWMAAKR